MTILLKNNSKLSFFINVLKNDKIDSPYYKIYKNQKRIDLIKNYWTSDYIFDCTSSDNMSNQVIHNVKNKIKSIKKIVYNDVYKHTTLKKLRNFFQILIYKSEGKENIGFFNRYFYKTNHIDHIDIFEMFYLLTENELKITFKIHHNHISKFINYLFKIVFPSRYSCFQKFILNIINKKNIKPYDILENDDLSELNKLIFFKKFIENKNLLNIKETIPLKTFTIFYKYNKKFVPNWTEINKLNKFLKNFNSSVNNICNDEIVKFNKIMLNKLIKLS